MSLDPKFDATNAIWLIRLTGKVSIKEIIAAVQRINASPPSQRDAPRLWDARAASEEPAVSSEDLRMLAMGRDAEEARGRTAVLVSRDVDFGLTRMYAAYVDQLPAEVRVFRDYAEAVAWLRGG